MVMVPVPEQLQLWTGDRKPQVQAVAVRAMAPLHPRQWSRAGAAWLGMAAQGPFRTAEPLPRVACRDGVRDRKRGESRDWRRVLGAGGSLPLGTSCAT